MKYYIFKFNLNQSKFKAFKLNKGDWCEECETYGWIDDGCRNCGAGY